MVTIFGDGFTTGSIVMLGSNIYDFNNANISYNSISFVTQPDLGLYVIQVAVNNVESFYEKNITYEFTSGSSPTIQSVKPLSVNNETEMIINGKNFGNDLNLVNIMIGSENCKGLSLNSSYLKCLLKGLNLGNQTINLNVKSKLTLIF